MQSDSILFSKHILDYALCYQFIDTKYNLANGIHVHTYL